MQNNNAYENLPCVLTVRDIAQVLGVGYSKALKIVKYTDISTIKVGKSFRVAKSNFICWLDEQGKRNYEFED